MTDRISGSAFKQMITFGAACVTQQKQAINDLNVFPVPDGDTGTNMSLTIQTAVNELKKSEPATVGEAAKITAGALLRGARGNSGVILSLLFRGISKELKGCKEADGAAFAAALQEGVAAAYNAVMKPAEGTVLTVSRLAAARAVEAAQENPSAEYVLEQVEAAKETCTDPVVLIEQRVDFSRWVEQGFGTADCIIIADGTLRVIDYKHGLGVLVSAEENPQMQCYALGALELFDDIYDIDQVSMTIYQPRRQNVSTYEISKDDLYRWADEVLKPTADLAFAGDGNFLCGEWCGFCKAKNECRARAEANLKLAQHDFKLPPLLTDTEIEVILGKVDELVSWASDIKEYALQQALSGKEWTGFKIVEGRSNRRYSNEAAVIDAVEKAGFDPYEKKLLGITAMQKLLGKSRFDELLTAYIEKPQGKPTLVPDGDKRPAMNTAKNDFMEENDNE